MSEWLRCQFASLITLVRVRLLALKLKINNMTKKEFMAFSLPYGLKVVVNGKSNVTGEFVYTLYSAYNDTTVIEVFGESNFKTDMYKPILRPLDLTKEIEHNGEKFVPIERLAFEFRLQMYQFIDGAFYDNNYRRYLDIKEMPFVVVLKLIEWKFAVGLDKNDYIDVNTMNENTYK